MDALAGHLNHEAESAFREEYTAQCLWHLLHMVYKKPPVESFVEVIRKLRQPRDTRTALDIKDEVLARLTKE